MFQLISIVQGALAYAISLIFSNIIPFKHLEESSIFLEFALSPFPLIRERQFLRGIAFLRFPSD